MTYALGSRSLSFCAHVDPKLMAVVKRAIAICPVDFGMTEDQSRTVAQQAAKVAAGVSHVRPGPAARHMIQPDGFSKAVDLVPWIDGRFQWGDKNWKVHTADGRTLDPFFDIAAAMVASCKASGTVLRWGGCWASSATLPATAAELRAAVMAYNQRHAGPDFNDLPHWEIAL